jgi:hypothetical protein
MFLASFRGTSDVSGKNPRALLWCADDTFSDITNCEIQRPGLLITRNLVQVSRLGCTYDWLNLHLGRKLILGIPPPIAHVHLPADSEILRVSEVHRFKIEVHLKWLMCQKEIDRFENIPAL